MSYLTRRLLLAGGAAGMASIGFGKASRAAEWPTRPVTILVPYVAGGVSDMMGRLCAQFLTEKLGQPFIVENRAGGSGVVAATAVANAAPDGHMVLFGPPAPIVTVPMLQKVGYSADSFAPISVLASYPFLLAVKSSLPVKTLAEFIAYAKTVPGKLNYSSAGFGAISHMVAAFFAAAAGIDIVHVPYKGAAPATAALLTGEVEIYFGGSSELIPHMSGDKIRVLATSGAKRLSNLPNLPSASELLPSFTLDTWNGFVAPLATPRPIIDRFAATIHQAATDLAIADRLLQLGIYPDGNTPEEFAKQIIKDKVFYQAAIKAAGIT
jgi:tripartite-type tricarboxylate transporter receptor subunit TctC